MNEWVSATCGGETCSMCGQPATAKVGENISCDDPFRNRHNLTAYVCREHFAMIFGNDSILEIAVLRATWVGP